MAPWRLITVRAENDYCLYVVFVDGTSGLVNLKSLIFDQHAGVFSQLKDQQLFKQVHLSYGVATWPGEIDLAPDVMHDHIQKHGYWNIKG